MESTKILFVAVLKVPDENSRISQVPLLKVRIRGSGSVVRGTDPWIRIRANMSRIRSIGWQIVFLS
jgi:hypothetical protein